MATEAQQTQASSTTAGTTHTVVHFEIPADDVAKLCRFYAEVFGWQFHSGPGMETYMMVQTGKGEDSIGGGIFPREQPGQRPVNYIGVESVKGYAEKVQQHGGTLLHTFTIPGMGHGAITNDPEGNPLGLWQTDSSAREDGSQG